MSNRYIVVRNQHGEFAVQAPDGVIVTTPNKDLVFHQRYADGINKMNNLNSTWTPISETEQQPK